MWSWLLMTMPEMPCRYACIACTLKECWLLSWSSSVISNSPVPAQFILSSSNMWATTKLSKLLRAHRYFHWAIKWPTFCHSTSLGFQQEAIPNFISISCTAMRSLSYVSWAWRRAVPNLVVDVASHLRWCVAVFDVIIDHDSVAARHSLVDC